MQRIFDRISRKMSDTSVLVVLIFIIAMSHAVAKSFIACCRPDSKEAIKTISTAKKLRTNLASLNRDTHIGLAQLIHPVPVNCPKER